MKLNFDPECGGLGDNLLAVFSKSRRCIRRALQKHTKEGNTGYILRYNHNTAILRLGAAKQSI